LAPERADRLCVGRHGHSGKKNSQRNTGSCVTSAARTNKDRAQAEASDHGDAGPVDQYTANVGGRGLRGRDKQQSSLRDVDRPAEHDDGDATPKGLRRPRKGPYDKNTGRAAGRGDDHGRK
jgi:hypothetical protein